VAILNFFPKKGTKRDIYKAKNIVRELLRLLKQGVWNCVSNYDGIVILEPFNRGFASRGAAGKRK
jgi:hypothetical protein